MAGAKVNQVPEIGHSVFGQVELLDVCDLNDLSTQSSKPQFSYEPGDLTRSDFPVEHRLVISAHYMKNLLDRAARAVEGLVQPGGVWTEADLQDLNRRRDHILDELQTVMAMPQAEASLNYLGLPAIDDLREHLALEGTDFFQNWATAIVAFETELPADSSSQNRLRYGPPGELVQSAREAFRDYWIDLCDVFVSAMPERSLIARAAEHLPATATEIFFGIRPDGLRVCADVTSFLNALGSGGRNPIINRVEQNVTSVANLLCSNLQSADGEVRPLELTRVHSLSLGASELHRRVATLPDDLRGGGAKKSESSGPAAPSTELMRRLSTFATSCEALFSAMLREDAHSSTSSLAPDDKIGE